MGYDSSEATTTLTDPPVLSDSRDPHALTPTPVSSDTPLGFSWDFFVTDDTTLTTYFVDRYTHHEPSKTSEISTSDEMIVQNLERRIKEEQEELVRNAT